MLDACDARFERALPMDETVLGVVCVLHFSAVIPRST